MTYSDIFRDVPFSRRALSSIPLTLALVSGTPVAAGEGVSIASPDTAAEAFRKNVTLLGIQSAPAVPGGYVFASTSLHKALHEDPSVFKEIGASASLGT